MSPKMGSSSAGASSTTDLDLELRILTLLDPRVGFAINALQDGEEVSIAVKESMYILRVAYCHLRELRAHNDGVEDIIEIYASNETDNYHSRRNFALLWVMATAGRYNLNSGATMTEELKMIMDCLIHRLNHHFNLPRTIYESLRVRMNGLWLRFQSDLQERDLRTSPSEAAGMDVDQTSDAMIVDPPVERISLDQPSDELNDIRHRTMSGLRRQAQAAFDRGDLDAAECWDDQLTMVNLM